MSSIFLAAEKQPIARELVERISTRWRNAGSIWAHAAAVGFEVNNETAENDFRILKVPPLALRLFVLLSYSLCYLAMISFKNKF